MKKFTINFQPIGKHILINPGESLLVGAQIAGVGMASVCGGAGTCEECKVQIISGMSTPPTLVEEMAIDKERLESGWRLACQAIPLGDIKIFIPPESMTTSQRLQYDGEDVEMVRDLGLTKPGSFGIAVDIGTTKVALYLLDLFTGKTIAKDGFMNPQIAYGEDIISRLAYVERTADGAELLRSILFREMGKLINNLCKSVNIVITQITNVVMVGNTAMHHLAAGLPVKQLGFAPFLPASLEPISLYAENIDLNISHETQVYFPPVIAGYVGSDHLAMIISLNEKINLARRMGIDFEDPLSINPLNNSEARNIMALDIGTNTEISLLAGKNITCCSCASGPAFEGAHIHEGMRASPGAIERAFWQGDQLIWQTIDSQLPIGICGSGILDVIAGLLHGNVIKPSGQLVSGNSFPIVKSVHNKLGRDIVITRKDVHEIQLAKSAIRSAIDLLLQNSGLVYQDIDEFYVAGAFGTFLDIKSAIRIGMFPSVEHRRIHQIGNAAGMGAKQMVLSSKYRKITETLARKFNYLELASKKEFHDVFVKNLLFN